MDKKCNVALIQEYLGQEKNNNRTILETRIREAAKDSELIVLSELHDSAYFCQTENTENFDLAEPIPGESTDYYGKLAKELSVVLVTSFFEERATGLHHNTAAVFEKDGTIAGTYRKMHIPDDPGYYEKFYFAPGDLGFKPIPTSAGTLGLLICWDQWFPEAARLMALAGAEILIYPTAIGFDPADNTDEKQRQLDSWITIQRSHAIANGSFLISANRTGLEEPGIDFWGNSFICGPQGEFLAQAKKDFRGILKAKLDFKKLESVRRIWPFFRDRRIDAYSNLTKRFL